MADVCILARWKSVYVAAPLHSSGMVNDNIRKAFRAANELISKGFVPLVPHVFWFQGLLYPQPEKFWIEYDIYWLAKCDILLRLPGYSKGADGEVEYAENHGIPVYYTIEELITNE